MNYPRITVVTPNFNGAKYLEQTILSVINQSYPNLEYIIIDGYSNDSSVEIIKKYEKHLSFWVSEPDNSMYEALQKGFQKSTGEIMGWLNSDDMLHPNSLFTLADVFTNNIAVDWLEGVNTMFDVNNRTILVEKQRPKYLFWYLSHAYKLNDNSFVQQESTFWRRSLWVKAGAHIDNKLKLAGDFELWVRFFLHAELFHLNALIGGFRYRGEEQLSVGAFDKYILECDHVTESYRGKLTDEERKRLRKYIKILNLLLKVPKIGYFLKNKYLKGFFQNREVVFHIQTSSFKVKS